MRIDSVPLDLEGLLSELSGRNDAWSGLPPETVIGHVNLRVANLAEAEAFYVGVLGFDMMSRYGAEALFVSAGGYHGHVGLNTWEGVDVPPPPPGSIGLRRKRPVTTCAASVSGRTPARAPFFAKWKGDRA